MRRAVGVRIVPVPERPTVKLSALDILVLLQVDSAVAGRSR